MDLNELSIKVDGDLSLKTSFADHESRHSANREGENEHNNMLSERTPLLPTPEHQIFPQFRPERSFRTTLIISLLLVILIAGVIIGIYLLVIQDESENILPPVEKPLQLVSRIQWDHGYMPNNTQPALGGNLKQVMVVETGTDQCFSTETCIPLLWSMKMNETAGNSSMPYNFLISSNGQAYEALGWKRSSPLLASPSPALILAFIGNFSQVTPTTSQLEGARLFIDESVSRQVLRPSYVIVANQTEGTQNYLYQSLKQFPHSLISGNA